MGNIPLPILNVTAPGIAFSTGKAWEVMRKYCMETLRDFGFRNRGAMEQLLHEEIEQFLTFMEEDRKRSNGKIHFSIHYFHISFINVMASLIIGSRHSYEDPQLKNLLQYSDDWVKNGVLGTGLITAFPFLRFICPGLLGYDLQMSALAGLEVYARVWRRQTIDSTSYPSSLETKNGNETKCEYVQGTNQKRFSVLTGATRDI
jgi:hypothetical protein